MYTATPVCVRRATLMENDGDIKDDGDMKGTPLRKAKSRRGESNPPPKLGKLVFYR